jgi:hypothetical protein
MGKASILMEAMPYIQRFRGEVVVIKYGGSTMEDPALQQSFAGDITLLHTVGILPVIVHGGGPQISEAMATEGIEPSWVDGLRVTDEATMSGGAAHAGRGGQRRHRPLSARFDTAPVPSASPGSTPDCSRPSPRRPTRLSWVRSPGSTPGS